MLPTRAPRTSLVVLEESHSIQKLPDDELCHSLTHSNLQHIQHVNIVYTRKHSNKQTCVYVICKEAYHWTKSYVEYVSENVTLLFFEYICQTSILIKFGMQHPEETYYKHFKFSPPHVKTVTL